MRDIRDKFKGKLVFIDVETSLLHIYTHHIGPIYLSEGQVIKDKQISVLCYKVEGWKAAKSVTWGKDQDDTPILETFTELADKGYVFVAQNGDRFDRKVINGRLWLRGLPPVNNLLTLDTLKFSRQNMKLTSHKLNFKSRVLGLGGKDKMVFEDWIDVEHNNQTALRKMVKYCKKDVDDLQEIFWSLLPYVDKLPVPMGRIVNTDRDSCPKCGETTLWKWGTKPMISGLHQVWKCSAPGCCYRWADSRVIKER